MHIKLFLLFLTLRPKPFTEKELSAGELARLRRYALGEYSREMFLCFGRISVRDGYVLDVYDFHPQPWTSILNILQNFACVYHYFGYRGYPIRIKLY